MKATIAQDSVGPFPAIALENRHLRAVIIPQLGGRVWSLEDLIRDRQWIWHRDDIPLKAWPVGAIYDEVWAGGWEELFPNDAPGWFEGRKLPDHGEWWATPWKVTDTREGTVASVRLAATLACVKASCMKEFRLSCDDSALSVSYAIQSLEPQPFHFLFKQHLPVRVTPDCRLALPGGRVEPVDAAFSTVVPDNSPFNWPIAGESRQPTDLRVIPSRSTGKREFLYVRELSQNWCGVDDLEKGASLRMNFDVRDYPFVWLFLSYGGWRDQYTVVLEPCTNMPKSLAEAVKLRQSGRLEPGQEFKTEVTVSLGGLQSGS